MEQQVSSTNNVPNKAASKRTIPLYPSMQQASKHTTEAYYPFSAFRSLLAASSMGVKHAQQSLTRGGRWLGVRVSRSLNGFPQNSVADWAG